MCIAKRELFPHPVVLIEYLGLTWLEIAEKCGCKDPRIPTKDDATTEESIEEYQALCRSKGSYNEGNKPCLTIYARYLQAALRNNSGTIIGIIYKISPSIQKIDCYICPTHSYSWIGTYFYIFIAVALKNLVNTPPVML